MNNIFTKACLQLAVLALVTIPHWGALAQNEKQKRRGFLLQIADEKGLLTQPPEVTLRGNLGLPPRKTTPRDDGVNPDVKAGDRLYVQPVPTFFDSKVNIEVRSGDKLWKAQAVFKPDDVRARVIVILEPNGKTQTNILNDNAPPPNAPGPRPPPREVKKEAVFIAQDELSFSSKLGTGFVLWVIALVLFAASLALIRFSRKGDEEEDEEDEEGDEDRFDDVDEEDGPDTDRSPGVSAAAAKPSSSDRAPGSPGTE